MVDKFLCITHLGHCTNKTFPDIFIFLAEIAIYALNFKDHSSLF